MNKLIIEDEMGRSEVLESRNVLFNLSDFIEKWARLEGRSRFYNNTRDKWGEWRHYVGSSGAVAKLFSLMKKYGVRNHRLLYNFMELDSGEMMGVAHGEYLQNLFDQKFKSPIKVRLELDEAGESWIPRNGLTLPLISDKVSKDVLRLLPMEDEDEKREWINKAISVAAVGREWESLPFRQFYDDDVTKIDEVSSMISEGVKTGEISSFDTLKSVLLKIWIERKAPKILL